MKTHGTMKINFTKMSGAGNDFVVIDNMDKSLHGDMSKLARVLCSRHFGIGGDGLLLLEPSELADFTMRYYNADGSYGGMCGNGGRCVARFAVLSGIACKDLKFVALDHTYHAAVGGASVKLQMRDVSNIRFNVIVPTVSGIVEGSFVNTGSPHFVTFCDDLEATDIERTGREIRHSNVFTPEGCNVNFVKLEGTQDVSIRTYERGVEAETLACGTGSVAAALSTALKHGAKSPVSIKVRSGELLLVYFEFDGNSFSNIVLEGSAHVLFSGNIALDDDLSAIVDSTDILPHHISHS